jgi:conjugal transfer pilus assembly protein TraV
MRTHHSLRPAIALCAVLVTTLGLGACSANPKVKYQCQATGGVACMSMSELYEATSHADRVVSRDQAKGQRRGGQRDSAIEVSGGALQFAAPAPAIHLDSQIPIRTPAKVMRIWIAPWVDDAGDLHLAGHLFTEIQGRRWAVGDNTANTVPVFTPLQVGSTPAN